MPNRLEVRLSGTGGQGLITAGIILAEASGIYDGKNVVQSEAFGTQSRGGASKADVIISDGDDEGTFPEVTSPDILLAMSQPAANTYAKDVKPSGVMVLDSFFVKQVPQTTAKVHNLPLTTIAREQTGMDIAASIVGLGVISAVAGIVSRESLEKAVRVRSPKGFEEKNIDALRAGFRAGDALKGQSQQQLA